uniref:Family with sequence similarity 53 member C n=1 Tax=Cynoglossus semilaevis TaxID=244447 RepID=A0A3P8VXW4_CYNSE
MHVSFTDESLQTSPPPPPPKRHCRSLSVPEDLFQCRSNWHPSASKVWTPVKRGCQSRGASISGSAVNAFPLCAHTLSSDSPLPWSFSWDPCDTLKGACSTSFATPSSCSSSPAPLIPHSVLQRRFSLSPVHIQDTQVVLRPPQPCPASSPTSACSTPSSSRRNMRPALPRCHSQPCDMRKPRLKRRYDADVPPYTRPGLDFGKMTQVRQTTQGYVKCNWDSCQAPLTQAEQVSAFSPADFLGQVSIGPLSESEEEDEEEEDKRTWSAMAEGQKTVFERDCTELDLNLIEEN